MVEFLTEKFWVGNFIKNLHPTIKNKINIGNYAPFIINHLELICISFLIHYVN